MATSWIGSCNKTPGRKGYRPEAIVIHIMADDHIANVDKWFNTPEGPKNLLPVSAHYGVAKNGDVHQYVQEMDTAWHAGRVYQPTWAAIKAGVNPNLYTIGIEHEGQSGAPWTDAMYEATASLMAAASQRWSIPLDRDHVAGHGEIYGHKPFCPGAGVDLDHLILMAQSVVLSGVANNHVPLGGTVTARTKLNIRLGAPSSHADLVRTVVAGTPLAYVGFTSNGETVHGNAHWYADAAGDYFWAGGTDRPVPA